MTFDVSAAVTPRQLATSLRRDLKNPRYLEEIERSRKDMFAGRLTPWEEVLGRQEVGDENAVRS
jgi:hypothetical protein